MLSGSYTDRSSRILQIKKDDKSFSKISPKDQNSIKGESSFRVNYYNGVSGAVPFIWETRPGTPKHKLFEDTSLPPLTPPPSYLFTPKQGNSGKKKNSKTKIFNSIFPRVVILKDEKIRTHDAASSLSSSSVSSSLSSSFSASSMSRDLYIGRSCRNGNRRSMSVVDFRFDEDADDTPATTSTMCFGVGRGGYSSSGGRNLRLYRPVKNAILSFVGGRNGTV